MKTLYTLSLLSLMILGGCGSLTGDDEKDIQTFNARYYNIEGVEYDCGDAPKGTTGSDGAFVFEEGEGCTFYVGSKELRKVSYRDLSDGIVLVETNDETMQFLQTLDSDGSVDTGIKILSSVGDYLETQNQIDDFLIPSFISESVTINDMTMATLYATLAVAASGYSGEYATSDEAREYINQIVVDLQQKQIDFIELR